MVLGPAVIISRLQPTPCLPPALAGGMEANTLFFDSRLQAGFIAWFQTFHDSLSKDITRSRLEAG
jgi:hypothetical protein